MLPSPLNQFADRLILNNEVEKFIKGLIEKAPHLASVIEKAANDFRPKRLADLI